MNEQNDLSVSFIQNVFWKQTEQLTRNSLQRHLNTTAGVTLTQQKANVLSDCGIVRCDIE